MSLVAVSLVEVALYWFVPRHVFELDHRHRSLVVLVFKSLTIVYICPIQVGITKK